MASRGHPSLGDKQFSRPLLIIGAPTLSMSFYIEMISSLHTLAYRRRTAILLVLLVGGTFVTAGLVNL